MGPVSTRSRLLITEKAWQAAGVGRPRALQTTLFPSACLIRLAELSEDPMGAVAGFNKEVRKGWKLNPVCSGNREKKSGRHFQSLTAKPGATLLVLQ